MDMYRIHTEDHSICIIVGANSYRHAAVIVAEVIAENDPPGEGGICCVEKLCGPQGGGTGYYAAMVGDDRWYNIRPNKVTRLPGAQKARINRATFTPSELATILAALRYFQDEHSSVVDKGSVGIVRTMTDVSHFPQFDDAPCLGSDDIDSLCERLNYPKPPAGNLPNPTCQHGSNEGCMHCVVCGQCREDLDSTDTCMDCGGVDETDVSSEKSPDKVALCQHCDHFVDCNPNPDNIPNIAKFIHLEDEPHDFDHDAEPGESHLLGEWKILRPDLFIEHPDGRTGPNSRYHKQRGKIPVSPTSVRPVNQTIPFQLVDQSRDDASVAGSIKVDRNGIYIGVMGYGEQAAENGFGTPIGVEFYEGHLRVLAWPDINESDATVIDMEEARESKRQAS